MQCLTTLVVITFRLFKHSNHQNFTTMKKIGFILTIAVLVVSCTNHEHNTQVNEELTQLKAELDSIKNANTKKNAIASFLTFQNADAEEAMNFYVDLFDNSEILEVQRWGDEVPGKENTIKHATFRLNGNLFMCSDSPMKHEWNFTPGVSNFIECENEEMLQGFFDKLSEGGQVLMPPADYGWSQKFAFVNDKYGISWQLNLN